jgi:hypothetical protein
LASLGRLCAVALIFVNERASVYLFITAVAGEKGRKSIKSPFRLATLSRSLFNAFYQKSIFAQK